MMGVMTCGFGVLRSNFWGDEMGMFVTMAFKPVHACHTVHSVQIKAQGCRPRSIPRSRSILNRKYKNSCEVWRTGFTCVGVYSL